MHKKVKLKRQVLIFTIRALDHKYMTPRQCAIAAEAYAASLLAQAGYDVLVQYGANQPHYDLVANNGSVTGVRCPRASRHKS